MNSINTYSRPLTASQLKSQKAPLERLSNEYGDWGKIILNSESSNYLKKIAKLERVRIRRLQRHQKIKILKGIEKAGSRQQVCQVVLPLDNQVALPLENKDLKASSKDWFATSFNRFTDVLDTREPQSSDESGSNMSYDYDSRDEDSSDADSNTTDGYPED